MSASPDYDSPLALKAFLEEHGMAMQKKFGQNFLVNRTSRERLVDSLDITGKTTVWEIGPGLGSMTAELLSRGASVTAFEIDRGFCEVLRDIFSGKPDFTLIEGDVLKNWKKAVETGGIPSRLFGNLPYNIAAAIIGDMITEGIRFDTVVITVQKEVSFRMAAKPGSEDYSSFSVFCQWAYNISTVMDLAGGCFWPRPTVTSRAVRMTKKDEWPSCKSPELFMSLLRGLFSSRRKTVRNNFLAWLILSGKIPELSDPDQLSRSLLLSAGIDPGSRAETLALKDFLKLSDVVAEI
jgi:16S rRNA (adenine1518-N6/adenine1519-N6)-dimethyltransferase